METKPWYQTTPGVTLIAVAVIAAVLVLTPNETVQETETKIATETTANGDVDGATYVTQVVAISNDVSELLMDSANLARSVDPSSASDLTTLHAGANANVDRLETHLDWLDTHRPPEGFTQSHVLLTRALRMQRDAHQLVSDSADDAIFDVEDIERVNEAAALMTESSELLSQATHAIPEEMP
jgi:hypothetical protein